jgi:hypothetical protein
MPATLTALLGVAIHGARRAEADPLGLQRAAAMLVTASGARRLAWSLGSGSLTLNDLPLPTDSPGASLVQEAMTIHGAARIELPAGLTAAQWGDLADLLASGPGLYPTPDHLRAAIVGIIPGAGFLPTEEGVIDDEVVAEAGRQGGGASSFIEGIDAIDPALVSTATERADLSDLLDPLLDEGSQAVASRDYPRLAKMLLALHEIADRGDDATAAIINSERRRVVPTGTIETMVGLLPRAGGGSPIALALMRLGREGASAIVDVLATDPPRADRRILLEVLAEIEGAAEVLVRTLSSPRAALARDAAEVLGRMSFEGAVPSLVALLKHGNEDVRSAAWHALETIGTPDAITALRSRSG